MRINIMDHGTGWKDLQIILRQDEISPLIDLLNDLASNSVGHFHFRSTFEDQGGVADVEWSMMGPTDSDNTVID